MCFYKVENRTNCVSSVSPQNLTKGVHYRWGFFAPNGPVLDDISEMVDEAKVWYSLDDV